MPFCELEGLTIRVPGRAEPLVDSLSLRIARGEKVAIIGESGAGKSMTARAIAGVLPDGARLEGRIRLGGESLRPRPGDWAGIAAAHRAGIAMIFQDPRAHLDPRQRIGEFMIEQARGRDARRAARERSIRALARVRIDDPERCMDAFPHQLSGGMLQRVMIAAALIDDPALIIADEATSALDMTSQAQVSALLAAAVEQAGSSLLFVTHDLDLAAHLCDRAIVMRNGRIVDEAREGDVSEYTQHLLDSRPSTQPATLRRDAATLLRVSGLRREYRQRRKGEHLLAVADSSFEIRAGSCLALVGESGSGKSTTARMLVGLERPDAGSIAIEGNDLTAPPRSSRARRRRARIVQLIQQDPYLSLDPRQTARQAIEEAQRLHVRGSESERRRQLEEITEAVGLSAEMLQRRPIGLSGGQRQRVSIARALVTEPQVLVLDEAVSALDVSVQAQVLTLLRRLRSQRSMTMLFVTHDLNVVRALAEEVVVMQSGRIVERGETDRVLASPQHPYTAELLAAIPPRYRLRDSAPQQGRASSTPIR